MSQRVRSQAGRSLKLRIGVEGGMRQPRWVRWTARALARDCAPPRGIGHPTACAAVPSTRPKEALSGSFSAMNEWAERPAKSARVRSLRNWQRATVVAGRRALTPNLASRNGCFGEAIAGRRMSEVRSAQRIANGSIRRRQVGPSSPSAASASGKLRSSVTAVPSSRGCASGAGEWVDRGAKVVVEAGEGELHGAGCAANLGFGLEDFDLHAGLGEDDGGGET